MTDKKKAVVKKTPAPKKEANVLKEAVVKPVKGEERAYVRGGVVFEVTAIIPTQSYGNIQPKIQVMCNSIEEGRALVMPVIEDMYRTYSDGQPVRFLSRVEVTEKVVTAQKAPVTAPVAPSQPVTPPAPQATAEAPKVQATAAAPVVENPEAVRKAEKAISLAATEAALEMIQNQIAASTKIDQVYKPALLEQCKEKMASFTF